MTQTDILRFLKEHSSKWFTSKEISGQSMSCHSSVSRCLTRLRLYNMVQYRLMSKGKGNNFFEYKHKDVIVGRVVESQESAKQNG